MHQWVWQHSADLLEPEQQQLSQQFLSLSRAAQALLVRLLMRKGLCFRLNKLQYTEIENVQAAVQVLLHTGFLQAPALLDTESYGQLYTVAELKQQFPQCRSLTKKAELVHNLGLAHPEGVAVSSVVIQVPTTTQAWAERLLLLFFGNAHQDWSEFVLSDLGLYRYEQVAFSLGSRAFRHKADVHCYELLYRLRDQVAQACDSARPALLAMAVQKAAIVQTDSVWLQERQAKTLYVLGQWAEKKATDLVLAEQAYTLSSWPMAALRRARVLELQENYQAAWEQGQQIRLHKSHEAVLQKWLRMEPRLQKKLGLSSTVSKRTMGFAPQRYDLSLALSEDKHTVEHRVRLHYHSEQAPVYYVENSLIQALFALWCWDALYAPIAGAFFHPYQRGPADLYSPNFYQRRQAWFAPAWASLEDGSYQKLIVERWHSKHGLQCSWVQWSALSIDVVRMALQCIPAADLRLIFQRLLEDLRENRSGLPDLIRFWPQQHSYEWIEVKGPGDRLQDNQIRWLQFFAQHSMPARVCDVRWC